MRDRRGSRIAGIVLIAAGIAAGSARCPAASEGAETAELPAPVHREIDFDADVRPIFARTCLECHGEEKRKGGLRLDSPAAILQGGDSGEPIFVEGSSAESHLVRLVARIDPDEAMPPDGKGTPLAPEEVGILRAWIDQGARMPGIETGAASEIALSADHWSFRPVVRPEPPTGGDPEWVANPVDAFVLARLQEKGLAPSPRADRRTLIQRLHLVMLGLPPTAEETEAFVADESPTAWADLVDRTLASPHYGERWARHWLDIVRFAETNGFETNRERLSAWRFRDYVIDSFNADKPYDRFIREQIAGDALGADVATGFLVAGPYDIVKSPDINLTLMQRQDELADMVDTTGTAFLGLTLGCARCHNHKFDPILQKDYYSLQAVFAGVNHGERPLPADDDPARTAEVADLRGELEGIESRIDAFRALAAQVDGGDGPADALRPPVTALGNREAFGSIPARFVRFTIHETSSSEPCIDELEVFNAAGENVALAERGTKATASGTLPGYEAHKLEHLNDGLYGNARSWISNANGKGWVQLEFPAVETIERIAWARDREGQFKDRVATDYVIEASLDGAAWQAIASSADRQPFNGTPDPTAFLAALSDADQQAARAALGSAEALRQKITALETTPTAWAGTFSQPEATHRLYRGDPMAKREVVAPDTISVLGTLGMAVDEPEQQRRVRLAEWIASPDNPLTARVLVNRLWQYQFGTGIVDTPSDLGANGTKPTHPDLLDWLATEFVDSGWSIKHMQRLILLSNTWQQSSAPNPEAARVDAASRYLWRFPPRRLEAEAIRDRILAVAGSLDLAMGGPGFYLHDVDRENVVHYHAKESTGPAEWRRMVYLFKIRQEQDAVFGAFDCPDGNQVVPKRSRSTTPLQSLNLFNSPFVLQQAEILARRLENAAPDGDVARQAHEAFTLFYGRPPEQAELDDATSFIRQEGLTAFCRALYNTNEFLFVF